MKTAQALERKLKHLVGNIELVCFLCKEGQLSEAALHYLLMLFFIGKVPNKGTPAEHYPVFYRASLKCEPKAWQIRADKKVGVGVYQLCIPLSSEPETEHLEFVMPPILILLCNQYIGKHGTPLFQREAIKEAAAFIQHFKATEYATKGFPHLLKGSAINQTLLDFVRQHSNTNELTAVLNENTQQPKHIGHAGGVYESLTSADVQADLTATLSKYTERLLELHCHYFTRGQHNRWLIDLAPHLAPATPAVVMYKDARSNTVAQAPQLETRAPKFLSGSDEAKIYRYLNRPIAKQSSLATRFNTISTQCFVVLLLMTNLRPHHSITQYKFNLKEKLLLRTEKGNDRRIFLHQQVSRLIKHYLIFKRRFAELMGISSSPNHTFETYQNFSLTGFVACDVKALLREVEIYQADNIFRHHFNYLLQRQDVSKQTRNFLMGHGNNQDRHMPQSAEIQSAVDSIFQHHRLQPIIDGLIQRMEACFG